MYSNVLFTHDDLDGVGCRVVYEIAHSHEKKGIEYNVFNCSNAKLDETVLSELDTDKYAPDRTIIYFADICGKPDTLSVLKSRGYQVYIFDHHITNLHALDYYPNAIVMEANTLGQPVSGTSLLFQYFCSVNDPELSRYFKPEKGNARYDRIAHFVDTVRSYDTYEWKQTGNIEAKQLQTLFFMIGIENFSKKYVTNLLETTEDTPLINDSDMMFVKAKMEFEQSTIDSFTINDVIPIQLLGAIDDIMHPGCMIIANKGAPISEIGYQFLQKHPEFDFIVGINFNYPGREISFRARDDKMNLGQNFAARIGGGGHPKAAGATMPSGALSDVLNIFMKVLTGGYSEPDIFIN